MEYKCELIDRPAQPVLSIRKRVAMPDMPRELGQSYGAIAGYLGQMGQHPTGAPFAAYSNMEGEKFDVEMGFPAPKVAGQGDIKAGEIPAGKMVSCLHVGPYDQCEAAYNAINQWMQAHGYETSGVVYELYLNDPAQTPPDALQTQILFPVKGK